MIAAMKKGRERGGFPDWMLEYGKNLLMSCDDNALLFTGSHSDTNAAWYLQFVENYRSDVTVIPIGLLDQSWFLRVLNRKNKWIQNFLYHKDLPSENKHKLSSKSGPVVIPISKKVCRQYGLNKSTHCIRWIDKTVLFQE